MIYRLRRHFGISAREAFCELPAWEIDVLLAELARDNQDRRGQ